MTRKELTFVALFAAIMGALGMIPPIVLTFTPVPITLQTVGVLLAGGILGARLGALSQIVFLLLVAAGMPLLSGGRGGLSVFVGPSVGYLIGYPLAAFVVGYLFSRIQNLKLYKVLLVNLTAGIFVVYLIGIPMQAFMMDIPVLTAVKLGLVYLPGDALKAIIASILVYKLRKHPFFVRALSKKPVKKMMTESI